MGMIGRAQRLAAVGVAGQLRVPVEAAPDNTGVIIGSRWTARSFDTRDGAQA